MEKFIIEANSYLSTRTQGFYHTDYFGYGKPNNPDYIYLLKNDLGDTVNSVLLNATSLLRDVLLIDFPKINNQLSVDFPLKKFTACVIPRSKTEISFLTSQQLFRDTVNHIVKETAIFDNGVDYIQRTINTRTTHRRFETLSYNNDGKLPYEGITLDTCYFSPEIQGKNILLIDDVYTCTVNVVEDAIQALYNKGAKNVVFYALAKTLFRRYN